MKNLGIEKMNALIGGSITCDVILAYIVQADNAWDDEVYTAMYYASHCHYPSIG